MGFISWILGDGWDGNRWERGIFSRPGDGGEIPLKDVPANIRADWERYRQQCWQDVQNDIIISVDLRPAQQAVQEIAEKKYGNGSYQVSTIMSAALHLNPACIEDEYGQEIADACRALQYEASIEGRRQGGVRMRRK